MAEHYLLTDSTCCYFGSLDLSGQAVSKPFLACGIFSNRAPGFRMVGMEA